MNIFCVVVTTPKHKKVVAITKNLFHAKIWAHNLLECVDHVNQQCFRVDIHDQEYAQAIIKEFYKVKE